MNLQLFLELGGFIVVVGGILWSTAFQKGRSEQVETNLNTKIDQHIVDDERVEASIKNQQQKLWEWKDQHEREAANMRLELQKQIGRIEAGLSIHDSQYAEILRLIQSMHKEMSDKMDKLEKIVEKTRRD